jgi:hypothetical protein
VLTDFLISAYAYLALVVAILGRRTRLGFFRSLLLAIVVTPPLAALALFFFYPARQTVRVPKAARLHKQRLAK